MWQRSSHDNISFSILALSCWLWKPWKSWSWSMPAPTPFSQAISPAIVNTNWVFLVCITLSFTQFLGQLWGQKLKEWPSIRCSATVFHHHYHTSCLLKLFYYTSVLHLLQFRFRSLLHIISTFLAPIFISALCFQYVFNYPTQNSYHIKHCFSIILWTVW